MHLLAWAFAQQESLGLPKCARVCMKKAALSATSWGCLSSTFSCLCENHWFADGYDYCVRQSCGVTDTDDAKSRFETQCNKLFKRDVVSFDAAQAPPGPSSPALSPGVPGPYSSSALHLSVPVATVPGPYSSPALDLGVPVATIPGPYSSPALDLSVPVATLPGPYSSPSSHITYHTFSSTASAPIAPAPGSMPSTTSSPMKSSSSPIISSTSITAIPSTNTSPPASGGVSQSAKIGIGLGVPLAILLLALMGYVLYRYRINRQKSRGGHEGSIAAAQPYPAVDNAIKEEKGIIDVGKVQSRYKNDDPVSEGRELHGQHIPPYSRELEGSPGHGRKELPG